METPVQKHDLTSGPRALMRALGDYRTPRIARSVLELLVTLIPFAFFWALSWVILNTGHWIGLAFILPAAGFLVRLFMIQHNCKLTRRHARHLELVYRQHRRTPYPSPLQPYSFLPPA